VDRRPRQKGRLAIGGLVVMVAAGAAIIVPNVMSSGEMAAHPSIPCSSSVRSSDGILSFGTLLPRNTGAFVHAGPALDADVQLAMEGYRKPFSVSLLTGVSVPQ
jgi:hypothetical protein